ncbi:MAG: AMP-binding protein [Deltaproteobacteria bacterium]|nr:AMP-binding protein [Deltaproteobacteria bacterium]
MERYYDEKEVRTPEERKRDLSMQLVRMISNGYEKSTRLREIFREFNVTPSDFSSIDDLHKLPVISREKVVLYESEDPPYGGFAAPDVMPERVFISPGPVYEPHLKEYSLWARGYCASGFSARDIVLNTFSYHMVAAGLTFHEGLRAAGATVVPSGTSNTEQQVRLIKDLRITAFTGTPSFLMAIIKKAEESGYDFKRDFMIRRACFVAEPLQPTLREIFENEYGIDTYQMYGATEVGDIAYECREKKDWHVVEDAIVEIVDPATGGCVQPGELGEVVVTRLNDVFYLLRFGTGDLSSMLNLRCSCGRTSQKLCGIAGRVGDAVKVRGMFITKGQLARVQETFAGVRLQAVITRRSYKDVLRIEVEASMGGEKLKDDITDEFKKVCTVSVDEIDFVPAGTITENAPRIIDRREWE